MSDLAGPGEPRLRSPSPGRGGRFDDGGRRSPPPSLDRWNATNDRNGSNAPPARGRSVEFGNAVGTILLPVAIGTSLITNIVQLAMLPTLKFSMTPIVVALMLIVRTCSRIHPIALP